MQKYVNKQKRCEKLKRELFSESEIYFQWKKIDNFLM